MTLLADAVLVALAALGAVCGAGALIFAAAWFTVRGLRARPVTDGDEDDPIHWT